MAKSITQQVVDLLNAYGEAKFGGEWWPSKASAWISEGEELEELLEGPLTEEIAPRVVDLLNAYGEAKFCDEWWPGNAEAFIGARSTKLAALLDQVGGVARPNRRAPRCLR